MTSTETVLVCYVYEYRNASEDRIYQYINKRYAERGIDSRNVYRKEIFDHHEAGFNIAAWEALATYVQENDFQDRKLFMQDITDVYIADLDLDFSEDKVTINRKLSCQHHALKTFVRDLLKPNAREVNLSRRIDVDCKAMDLSGLFKVAFDNRYRTKYRLSTDAVWGYGRNFVKLQNTLREHIERVPKAIRFGMSDEVLLTYFMLHLPDVALNISFGEKSCQNHNVISQRLFAVPAAKAFLSSKKVFTYQHSPRVPDLIRAVEEEQVSGLGYFVSYITHGVDGLLTVLLKGLTLVLQEVKRLWIVGVYLFRRLMRFPLEDPLP